MSEEDNTGNDSEGIKNLRKQFETLQKQLAERDEKLAKFEAQERQGTVTSGLKSALKAKGLSDEQAAAKAAKVASFYSGDDASEESVGKWLEDNADVFGLQVQTQGAPQQVDPNAQNAQRISEAAFGTTPPVATTPAGVPVGDPAEIQRLYETSSIEQLQALGMLPKNLNGVRSAMSDW